MHRNKLLDLLDDYASRFPDEDVTGFIGFVRRQPRCFERNCFDDGHVTGSAWVVDTAGVRTLLTHHAKLKRWLSDAYQISAESLDLKWVAMDELASVTSEESVLRMARKWGLHR